MEQEITIRERAEEFAVRIINMYKFLRYEQNETVMSRQVLRSGTSIGANLAESHNSISDAEFLTKVCIALKESSETCYWLRLLHRTGYLNDEMYESIYEDSTHINNILGKIVKTLKEKKTLNS